MRVSITQDTDVVLVCQRGRTLAARLGLSERDQIAVVIAISEVAHNIIRYAQGGEIILYPLCEGERRGVVVIARDQGPGIPNVEQVLEGGYSTGGGLGMGLAGARRLMDEFEIVSQVGRGTVIRMVKWNQ
ncbi:MAG: ATP-binding protein [Anaerolineae bacterium]|nr:ATP-binding protein [Anaerolineae bacterium]